MIDERINKLASLLVNFSCKVQKGEKVLIEAIGIDNLLPIALVKEVYKAGGYPIVHLIDPQIRRELIKGMTKEEAELMAKHESARMDDMDAYIGIRGGLNAYENGDLPSEQKEIELKYYYTPVHYDRRVKHTKWVILRYPTPSFAQLANMSTEAFEEFYFNVCLLDYQRMADAMTPLVNLMNKTDKVRIVAPGTDLSFSIKGIPAIKCSGTCNIPDGEVYTAPVKDSVNGVIRYNTPSPESGICHENVTLTFKDGKIIHATSNFEEEINKVFDVDEGARYVGEFAIGVNPYVNLPMKDILFDEKIAGSIHFTPGACYDDAYNGNQSSLHWDLVLIQTPEFGGGEIYFDDVLIRKDGLFVLPELEGLNPQNLK